MKIIKYYISFAILLLSLLAGRITAQFPVDNARFGNLKFEENKKQWNQRVLYKADLQGGRCFLENDRLTFVYYNQDDIEAAHHHDKSNDYDNIVRCHAYSMILEGASKDAVISGSEKQSEYYNYFIGNDPSTWASYVGLYKEVKYSGIYPGVDLKVYSRDKSLKYDFNVKAGSDISKIKINYNGVSSIELKEGNLQIHTSVNDVTEFSPVAYQVINGNTVDVSCSFTLEGNSVGFKINSAVDPAYDLVIDPVIMASTFSGTTEDTWGHCAAYDNAGNIFSGGRNFGTGYPVTSGAYQTFFAGGVDIAISKYNPTGSSMIYSTYIGGSNEDIAQSLYVNSNNEIYIYGSTNSSNYPVSAGCFDNSLNSYLDILVTKLNASGSAILGSTYVGGSDQSGQNMLMFNYGDEYRGEIIGDVNGNVYVASFTYASDFPVTVSAYDKTYNGSQDAVVFKLSTNLNTMLWCTYLGGSGYDAAYSLRVDAFGGVYVVGGTNSPNFPTTGGVLHPNYMGGTSTGYVNVTGDGFITHLSGTGNAITESTFFGTTSFDEVFFVDLDADGDVYVFGYTQGSIPPTAGVYSNSGSSQVITKIDPTLSTVIYSTVFGTGAVSFTQEYNFGEYYSFSPTAFMVDICEQVYVAGWGNVNGFPKTGNAFQSYADFSSFYLMVLKKDATQMLFGTYYGDNSNVWDHVDGGTSRFDKKGIVYEAVCGCGSSFPTLSNAYSEYNNSWNCDIAVFKIDFQSVGVQALASAAPADTGCVPYTVNFLNNSMNAVDYIWDFGDGSPTSTSTTPAHIYTSTGTYQVMLIASDAASCNIADTTYFPITVISKPVVDLGNDTSICGNVNLLLDATTPGCSYQWSTGAKTPTITATSMGTYWVRVSNGYCSDADTISITSQPLSLDLGNDTTLCETPSFTINAGNTGCTYQWSTGATTQSIAVNTNGSYWVNISNGVCQAKDTINVTFVSAPPVDLGNDTLLCPGQTLLLDAGNPGSNYLWSTAEITQTITVGTAGSYWVDVSQQQCGDRDTINVSYVSSPDLGEDQNLCGLAEVTLDAGAAGGNYLWSTGANTQTIVVSEPDRYWVIINLSGCITTDTIIVNRGGSFKMYFPNTFTPSGDGLNDYFTGYGDGVEYFHMQIYNRWGQLLYETDDESMGWNGTFENVLSQSDIYVFKVDYKTTCSGEKIQEVIGRVFLLR